MANEILEKILEKSNQEVLARYAEYLKAESELHSQNEGFISREYLDKVLTAKKAWDKAYVDWMSLLEKMNR